MNKSEQLIACLEGEIAKRDARIVELEGCKAGLESDVARLREKNATFSAAWDELAAIKAQEPVAYIPVDRKFLEEIADSLDYDVRDVRDKVRSLLAAALSAGKEGE